MAETRDPKIRPGAWQKLALLRGALKEIPPSRAEWLLWMDMDVIINDPATTFPLSWYEKHDLVMWGDAAKVKQGDVSGMNSGVLLIRNGPWAAKLLDEVAKYAGYPVDTALEQHLASQLTSYDVGMYEQNPLTFLFKSRPEEFLDSHVRWEDALTMNVWYKKRLEPDVPQPPFVVHFAGCQLCNGFHPEKLGECDGLFLGHYAELPAGIAIVGDDIAAHHLDVPAIETHQARQRGYQGGLAGAIGPEQAEELALSNLKADSGQSLDWPKTFGNLLNANRWCHG